MQFLGLRRAHHDLEQEAVHLRLGQQIGAFELDRVLRRQDKKRRVKLVSGAEDRDLVLLHRLQYCGLGLGRGAVDFVTEHDMGEYRTGLEIELAAAVALRQHLRPDDIGRHQVGRELNPLEAQPQGLRGRLDHQGFSQPRNAFNQNMAAAKERGQDLSDGVAMAHDDAGDLSLGARKGLAEFGHALVR